MLENYRVGTVFSGPPNEDSSLYPQWKKATESGSHRTAILAAGQSIELEESIHFKVLHPPATPLRGPAWESNNNSLVLKLVYGDISFLLTGDIEEEAERYLVRNSDRLGERRAQGRPPRQQVIHNRDLSELGQTAVGGHFRRPG